MSTALQTLTSTLADKLGMGDASGLIETLKQTAFRGQVTDSQMIALLVVANQYGLNPWTKEIYAFPDKNSGIVPVVGVDGWARIINNHPQFDGMDFEYEPGASTCIIYRKDRSHPIRVTEYMEECERNTGPWKSHPRRMLRHKAMIQCARLAFGYGGIYDQDEAERIAEGPIDMGQAQVVRKQTALPEYTQEQVDKNLPAWRKQIAEGRLTPDRLITMVSTRYHLSDSQKELIRSLEQEPDPFVIDIDAHEKEPEHEIA